MTTELSKRQARDAAALSHQLANTADLASRLRLIASTVPGRIVFSTSLGIEDQAILHAIAESAAPVDVFTLDTGRLFPETIDTLAASEQRYGLNVRVLAPQTDHVESLVTRYGVLGFRTSIEARKACCHARKVVPLKRGLAGAAGWITGLRREQSGGRADVPFAAWNAEYGLITFNPLADWHLDTLDAYIASNDIPTL